MLKILKVTLIFLIITTSVSFSQQKRGKKKKRKESQEQVIEETEEAIEEPEEEVEDEYNSEQETEDNYYDDEDLDGEVIENEDTDVGDINENKTKPIKEGESVFKTKSGPSKVLLFLERFQFNFSSGYGLTSWKSTGYRYGYLNRNDNQIDTALVKFKGLGLNVPFHLQLLFDAGKVRIGGGASMDFYFMKNLKPNSFENELSPYNFKGIGRFRKFYGHLGYTYFENRLYKYLLDLEVGLYKGSPLVNTANNLNRPFINLGVTLERKYSEYFRMYLKPSIEYKSQPFDIKDSRFSIENHRLLSFYVLWGVSYSIPLVAKCPIKSCGVRVHHYHGRRVFRGNPFHRLQNPNYGEEDRKFIRERGKNKKKLDPY